MRAKSINNLFIHIMFALVIISNAMPLVFQREGTFILSMALSIVLITIVTAFRLVKRISVSQFIFAVLCVLLFVFSYIPATTSQARSYVNEHFLWFLFAGVGTLLIVNYKYDFELLMKVLLVAMLLMAPVILTTNYSRFDYEVENDEWMMTIYSIVPLLIAAIYYLFFGKSFLFKVLSVLAMALYFPMFIAHTPRGAVVTIVFALFLFIFQKQKEKGVSKKVMIGEGIAVLAALVIAFDLLINYLQQITDLFELRWLAKFVYDEDVSNGRSPLYQMALDGFLQSPVWGKGIASFYNYTGYPHNLFLQMLYETGVLMFLPVTYLLYQAFMVIILKKKTSIDYRLVSFLFIISIIQLLFSSTFWKRQQFWLLIWMMLSMIPSKTEKCCGKEMK